MDSTETNLQEWLLRDENETTIEEEDEDLPQT